MDWDRSVASNDGRPLLQLSKFSSPVLFSKFKMAIEGLSEGMGTVFPRDQGRQITTAMIAMTIIARARIESFFSPNVTVISLEVIGFLLGTTLSVGESLFLS